MKRWLFFSIALILLAISVYLYIPYLGVQSGEEFFRLLFLMGSTVFVFAMLYMMFSIQNRQKVKTLQNRLSMWTKLSYHVNQVGDEVFNELPIGIIALDDEFEIKWANPHAKNNI